MKELLINALIDEIRRYGRVEITPYGNWEIWIDYPGKWETQHIRIAHGTYAFRAECWKTSPLIWKKGLN